MDVSKFWGKVLGTYLIIVSLALFFNMQQFINNVYILVHIQPLMFITGFFTLILGLIIAVSHNIWEWSWRVLITLLAWLILLKGASIILYPHFIDKATILFVQSPNTGYVSAGIDFLLGVILCYFGFKRS